jgi:Bacteriocin-protection, YdeI or OmpD-Associated/Domain of unknown function (DU1801)
MAKNDSAELEKFLAAYPGSSREIALRLRDWVWDLYPESNELIYDNYNFLAFGWSPNDKMGDIFCSIAVGTRGVMFGFMWGSKLSDPENRLRGSGSKFRSLRVTDTESFPGTYVKKLLAEAYEISIENLKIKDLPLKGATIVKSISEKKRRPGMPKRAPQAERERHPMPDYILETLKKTKLFDAYNSRPPFQRNDYLGWIAEAKREETRQKRIDQMLDELRRGDVYMKMAWKPKK